MRAQTADGRRRHRPGKLQKHPSTRPPPGHGPSPTPRRGSRRVYAIEDCTVGTPITCVDLDRPRTRLHAGAHGHLSCRPGAVRLRPLPCLCKTEPGRASRAPDLHREHPPAGRRGSSWHGSAPPRHGRARPTSGRLQAVALLARATGRAGRPTSGIATTAHPASSRVAPTGAPPQNVWRSHVAGL